MGMLSLMGAASLILMMVLVTLNLQGLENQNIILDNQGRTLETIKNDTGKNLMSILSLDQDQELALQNQRLMIENQQLLIRLINQTKPQVSQP
jgi:hypothetical protein